MPEPLKNLYTRKLIAGYGDELASAHPKFDARGFQAFVFAKGWKALELKGRMRRITESLRTHLPGEFGKAIEIIKAVAPKFGGFEAMSFPEYVELYGLEDFETSVDALEHLTKFSSSEFAVRPFIVRHGDHMMEQMGEWAESDDRHVRRLATEGCRPRLPWAMALPDFKKDPTPILPILETLKQDDSEYVRRSVANNLNDISKDNPEIVLKTARRWHGEHPDTDRIVKHACRTMLKQGEPRVMKLFGYAPPKKVILSNFKVQKSVVIGDRLEFGFTLSVPKGALGKIRIEYAMHFLRKNGEHSRKVFKISESDIADSEKVITQSHSFKLISTRTYYPGALAVSIIVNGVALHKKNFELVKR
ncbi:MAG: DNA alkylation repair protein [Candidatus Hydrogenedentota bacterium]